MTLYLPGNFKYQEIKCKTIDEVKWGLRLPSRFAMRKDRLQYLPEIQDLVTKYIQDRIKVDFFDPTRELTLNMTVKEAEMMMSASPDAVETAEKGDLKTIHENYNSTCQQIEVDFLKTKDLISRITQSMGEKEQAIYDKFEEAGLDNLQKDDEYGLFDYIGLSYAIPSLENLVKINAFLEKSEDLSNVGELKELRNKLYGYLEVKTQCTRLEANIHSEFVAKVSMGETAA